MLQRLRKFSDFYASVMSCPAGVWDKGLWLRWTGHSPLLSRTRLDQITAGGELCWKHCWWNAPNNFRDCHRFGRTRCLTQYPLCWPDVRRTASWPQLSGTVGSNTNSWYLTQNQTINDSFIFNLTRFTLNKHPIPLIRQLNLRDNLGCDQQKTSH